MNTITKETATTTVQQLVKLAELQKKLGKKKSNKTEFKDLIGVNIGIKTYPKKAKRLDSNGNHMVDDAGKKLYENYNEGYYHTLVEFGTGKKIKVLLENELDLQLLGTYYISGLGYQFDKKEYYLDENTSVKEF